jgi:hypothetical protein
VEELEEGTPDAVMAQTGTRKKKKEFLDESAPRRAYDQSLVQ